jgi:hypothetical protein
MERTPAVGNEYQAGALSQGSVLSLWPMHACHACDDELRPCDLDVPVPETDLAPSHR